MNTEKYEPNWLLIFKGLIRPVLTVLFALLFMYSYIAHDNINTEYMKYLTDILWVMITFWFGERAIRNIGIPDYLKQTNSARKESIYEKEMEK